MKEDLAIALDASKSEDDRVDALDHLEMVRYLIKISVNYLVAHAEACEPQLVEQIDNANGTPCER
jgi:hypothetical protein